MARKLVCKAARASKPNLHRYCVNVSYQTPFWRDYDRELIALAQKHHGKDVGSGMLIDSGTRDMDFGFEDVKDAKAFAKAVRSRKDDMKRIGKVLSFDWGKH